VNTGNVKTTKIGPDVLTYINYSWHVESFSLAHHEIVRELDNVYCILLIYCTLVLTGVKSIL